MYKFESDPNLSPMSRDLSNHLKKTKLFDWIIKFTPNLVS